MKTTLLYLFVFLTTFSSCNSQVLNKKNKKDGKNKPHEKVIVNRKYDENGNLIEFDSTYTSYYSNFKGDTIRMDSLMNGFPEFFNQELFNMNSGNMFNPFFSEDSVSDSHFFHDDFFEQQFVQQNENMLRMMKMMDSIKNSFFERQGKLKK